jgi:hypothetical protein
MYGWRVVIMGGIFKAIGSIFGGSEQPKLPPPVEVPDLASAQKAANDKLRRGKLSSLIGGRRSPILTSPTGVTENANVGTKKLLGQ